MARKGHFNQLARCMDRSIHLASMLACSMDVDDCYYESMTWLLLITHGT